MTEIEGWLRSAFDSQRAGQSDVAEILCRRVLDGEPDNPAALHLLGVLTLDSGRAADAAGLFEALTSAFPGREGPWFLLGEARRKLGRLDEARTAYQRALSVAPAHTGSLNALGQLHQGLSDWDAAESWYRAALRTEPAHPFLLNNLGSLLLVRGRYEEARQVLSQAVNNQPDYPEALANLGAVALRTGGFEEAIQWSESALRVNPGNPAATHVLGSALHKLGRRDEAERVFESLTRKFPDDAQALYAYGAVMKDGRRLDDAESALRRSVELDPSSADAWRTLAAVLADQNQTAAARDALNEALRLRPSGDLLFREALLAPVLYATTAEVRAERARYEAALSRLEADPPAVNEPEDSVGRTPFYLAYQGENDRELQQRLASLYLKSCPELSFVAEHCRTPAVGRRQPIRVGIVSRFLHHHTIGKLNIGLVRHLDRSRFQVTVLRFPGHDDTHARAYDRAADSVVVLPLRLKEARTRVAAERLDVLCFTDIGMEPLTYFLAFSRLAPVQCVGWGHPVTTGIPTLDYFLSSSLMEPEGAGDHYSERLVRLPHVNAYGDPTRVPLDGTTRNRHGFDDGCHLYLCSQSLFKLHPDFDQVVDGILRADPAGVVAFISGPNVTWDVALRERFASTCHGLASRIRFLPRVDPDEFVRLQAAADVVLDTFPFGGGQTCLEAFAVGAPVVTWPGRFLRGRITLGLYRQMDLLDGVVGGVSEYVETAVRLGRDRELREDFRRRILERKHLVEDCSAAVRELETFLADAVGRAEGREASDGSAGT